MNGLTLRERRARLMGPNDLLFYEEPIQLVRGSGALLYDVNGREYLDCYNNVPCVGHCHPRVVEALCSQAATLNTHTRYLDEKMVSYCESLLSKFDGAYDRVALTCTGSEANDLALRLARNISGGEGIICTNGTYHGNTTAVSQLTSFYSPVGGSSPAIRRIQWPDTYRLPIGIDDSNVVSFYVAKVAEAIDDLEANGIKFAGMLACPIFANEGLPLVPKGYLEQVVSLVHSRGGVFIADEVQSGFGRTGRWWGYQNYDFTPDIITLGKPMGAGHPLAGLVTRRDLMDPYKSKEMYFNTFGGNPVSSAVGQAVLDVLEDEQLVDNASAVGAMLREALLSIKHQHGFIGDVRGSGLFLGIDIITPDSDKTPDVPTAARIVNAMREEGVLISKAGAHDNVLKIRPPLCFSKQQGEQLLTTLDRVLRTHNF